MPQNAPILIMSSERSGSNLLRTLLSNHSGISGPMAPQFLNLFPYRLAAFEPLAERANMVALIEAMGLVANHKTFGWGLEFDPGSLVDRFQPKDLLDAFHAMYRVRQEADGARRFVCKENRLFDHAPSILACFPDTRVLYLVRDPRDYVLSWQKAPILNNTPHAAACAWRDEQRACLAIEERFSDQVYRVTYEDLVRDPATCMTAVLEFLGEPVETDCFQVQGQKNKGQEWSSFWKNLTKPVQQTNFKKYREAFRPRELEMMETVCSREMAATGYPGETRQAWRQGPWFAYRERRLAAKNDRRLREEHADTVAVIEDRDRMLDALVAKRHELAGTGS